MHLKEIEVFYSAWQVIPFNQHARLPYNIQTAQEVLNYIHYIQEDIFKEVANEKYVRWKLNLMLKIIF